MEIDIEICVTHVHVPWTGKSQGVRGRERTLAVQNEANTHKTD